MLARLNIRLTICTTLAFFVLIGLGTWQLQRLYWKDALIEKLQVRSTAIPLTLPQKLNNLEELEFRRVVVTGKFLHKNEFYLVNRSLNGKPGLNILTFLKRADGSGHVLVNRGWVPFEKRDPKSRAMGQVKSTVAVEGIIRLARGPGIFTPDNEPHNNTWFYVDPPAMANVLGNQVLIEHSPFYILSANQSPGGLPAGNQWKVNLRNEHLEYAITWFCLAAGLLVIFFLYHYRSSVDESK